METYLFQEQSFSNKFFEQIFRTNFSNKFFEQIFRTTFRTWELTCLKKEEFIEQFLKLEGFRTNFDPKQSWL